MRNKEIIDRAARIVSYKLENVQDMNADSIQFSKSELLSISTALALAGVLCRINDRED